MQALQNTHRLSSHAEDIHVRAATSKSFALRKLNTCNASYNTCKENFTSVLEL